MARKFKIIGEAVKNLSKPLKAKYPQTEWKKIGAFRDFLIHVYFGVDVGRVWTFIEELLPAFAGQIESIISDLNSTQLER